jgi:hypothetical protein
MGSNGNAYGGEQGTFNAVFLEQHHSMFSGVWSPDERMGLP